MSKYSSHLLEKQKMKLKAATAKPERPRFSEQSNIAKDMFGMDEHFNSQIRNEDDKLSSELSRKWEGNGGGTRGDAFVSGLQSGMRKKSILDDKERMAKYKSGMEKLYAMVERQNQDLYQQEKLASARQAVMPNWMAYSQSFKGMTPAERKERVSIIVDKYNQIAGTNYRVYSVDGMEPWKSTLIDGDEARTVDMMDLFKTPEEMRIQIMMQSPEYRQMEGVYKAEQDMDNQLKNALIQQRQAKANEAQSNSPEAIQAKKQELIQSGQLPKGAIHFDEIQGHEQKERINEVREEIKKLEGVERGIEALNGMEEIFKKYPDISTSILKWANSNKREDTLLGSFINSISDQDKRDALLELEKYAANLALGSLEQFKGQRPTDIVKRIIKDTNPSGKFTPGAFAPLKRQYMAAFEKQKTKSTEAEKGWRGRYFPSYENLPMSKAEIIHDAVSKNPAFKDLTDEQILERINGKQEKSIQKFKLPPGVNPTEEELEQLRKDGIEVVR